MTVVHPAFAETEPAPEPQYHFENNTYSAEVIKARALMAEKKWPEAIVVLRSALREDPGSIGLELDLTRALAYSGRREEALVLLGQLGSSRKGALKRQMLERVRVLSRVFLSNTSFQIFQDGVNLMLFEHYKSARERFERALELEPANVEILARLSQCLVMEGDYDSAAERLRLARRLDPYEPQIRLWLGRALHQRGEIREALTELKSAYQELPSSETAAIWYAEALYGLSQNGAAHEILEDDLKRNPEHLLALVALSRHRLLESSPRDSQAAWAARKELQLALSRLSASPGSGGAPPEHLQDVNATNYNEEEAQPAGTWKPSPEKDLAFEPRPQLTELRSEIEKLMAEVDSRIDTSQK